MTRTPFQTRAARRTLACLVALLIALSPMAVPAAYAATPKPTSTWVDTYDAEKPLQLKDADLQGTACLLMDRATGRVLYDKNARAKRYPASTTKMMTLLLALEYGHLNDVVTLPEETEKVPGDSSRVPVFAGEQMSFADLLYGMMMKSGNDAANAVAVIVGGSLSGFADMMNERAAQLGCENTHFVNPHGYHDKDQYSTAYDLALIAREGMRHDTFRAIVSAKTYTMAATNRREKLRLETGNAMFVSSNKYYYEPLIGIKTGFHSAGGNCFVGAAKKDGINLISVTLKAPVRTALWMDTKRLMEYGFPQYHAYTFDQLYSERPVMVNIQNAEQDDPNNGMLTLTAVPGGSINNLTIYRLPDDYENTLDTFKDQMQIEYTSDLKAPIRQGDILGKIKTAGPDGQELYTLLVADRDVFEETGQVTIEEVLPWVELLDINMVRAMLALLALIVLLIIFARVRAAARRNRRRRELYERRMRAYERYRAGR